MLFLALLAVASATNPGSITAIDNAAVNSFLDQYGQGFVTLVVDNNFGDFTIDVEQDGVKTVALTDVTLANTIVDWKASSIEVSEPCEIALKFVNIDTDASFGFDADISTVGHVKGSIAFSFKGIGLTSDATWTAPSGILQLAVKSSSFTLGT